MLSKICSTAVLLLIIHTSYSQGSAFSTENPQTINRLPLNAEVPNLISQAVNFRAPTIQPISGSQKLVILDFWATWCTACIGQFPKLDSLQQIEKEDVKIVLVNTAEDSSKITTFLDKYNQRHLGLNLPITWNDQRYQVMFPHRSVPHYVWILNGKFLATSGPEAVTRSNIRALIADTKINFRMKNDVFYFDRDRPLLHNGNGAPEDNFKYRSLFTKELDGLKNGYYSTSDSLHQRFAYANFSARVLYSLILDIPTKLVSHRTSGNEQDKFFSDDLYAYELTVPVETSQDERTMMMVDDLDRYFKVKSTVGKRMQTVFKLKIRKKAKVHHNDTAQMQIQVDDDLKIIKYSNTSIQMLVSHLNNVTESRNDIPWFVDATKYPGMISVTLPDGASVDFETVKQALKQQGFIVKKGKRRVRSCVLTPQN